MRSFLGCLIGVQGVRIPDFHRVTDSDYYFQADGIDPNSRITLIIQDKDGKAVAQFPFDLKKVR